MPKIIEITNLNQLPKDEMYYTTSEESQYERVLEQYEHEFGGDPVVYLFTRVTGKLWLIVDPGKQDAQEI